MPGDLPFQLADQRRTIACVLTSMLFEQSRLGDVENSGNLLEVLRARQSLSGFPVPDGLPTDPELLRQRLRERNKLV